MLKRFWVLSAALVTALAGATSARADFTIDDFSSPASATPYSLPSTVVSSYESGPQSIGSGITRNIVVTQTQNTFGTAGATSGLFGNTAVGGRFVLSTNSGTVGYASLLYSYATPQNLSDDGTEVQFTIVSTDVNVPFSVRISNGTQTATQTGNVTAPGLFSLPITGFGINLATVTSIELLLNRNFNTGASTPEADVTLSGVKISTPVIDNPPAVPAPPALFLFAAAVPGLALARRLRRRTA